MMHCSPHVVFIYRVLATLKMPLSLNIGGDLSRADALSLLIRLGVAGAISFVTVRYLVKYMDPTYATKEIARQQAEKLLKQMGLEGKVELNEHEMQLAVHLVLTGAQPAWEEVGGLCAVIRDLQDRLIFPLSISSSASLLSPPKGVLLYGPPGCGKTLLARAVAQAAGARFLNLQVSTLTDKWYGESQKLTSALFSLAKKLQPSIIFIDEIDSLLRSRHSSDHEATAMMKTQFMSLWDGFASEASCRVVVMGATNRPADVDPAIIRRMPVRLRVPMPDASQREEILRVLLRQEILDQDVLLGAIAVQTPSLSGSDLKEVCRLAVVSCARELHNRGLPLDGAGSRRIKHADLMDAALKCKQNKSLDAFRLPMEDDRLD